MVKNRFAIGAYLPSGVRDGINKVYFAVTASAWRARRAGYTRANDGLPGPSGSSLSGTTATFTWDQARSGGLTSDLFNVQRDNANDSRAGLEGVGAATVEQLMREQGLTFDQARLVLHRDRLRSNGIDPLTGLPLDSKAVLALPARH